MQSMGQSVIAMAGLMSATQPTLSILYRQSIVPIEAALYYVSRVCACALLDNAVCTVGGHLGSVSGKIATNSFLFFFFSNISY